MAQMGFLIKSAQCSGCKACELACKAIHNFEIGPRARRVREVCGGGWSVDEKTGVCHPSGVFTYSVSYSCGHCDNPACVAVCPTGAHAKDEETGLVTIDQEQCIGCKSCIQACPYGAPQFVEAKGVTEKCDMCAELRSYGEEPACVAICPQRALKVGDIDELRAEFGDCADVAPLPSSADTAPNVVIVAHRNAKTNLADVRILSLEQ